MTATATKIEFSVPKAYWEVLRAGALAIMVEDSNRALGGIREHYKQWPNESPLSPLPDLSGEDHQGWVRHVTTTAELLVAMRKADEGAIPEGDTVLSANPEALRYALQYAVSKLTAPSLAAKAEGDGEPELDACGWWQGFIGWATEKMAGLNGAMSAPGTQS